VAFHFLSPFVNVVETDIRLSKHDFINVFLQQDVIEFLFITNRNAIRILRAGERCRVAAVVDIGNLRGRECDDVKFRFVTIATVEYVEVPTRGAHDDDSVAHSVLLVVARQYST